MKYEMDEVHQNAHVASKIGTTDSAVSRRSQDGSSTFSSFKGSSITVPVVGRARGILRMSSSMCRCSHHPSGFGMDANVFVFPLEIHWLPADLHGLCLVSGRSEHAAISDGWSHPVVTAPAIRTLVD